MRVAVVFTKILPDPVRAVKSVGANDKHVVIAGKWLISCTQFTALAFVSVQLALVVQWSSVSKVVAPRTSVPAAVISFVDTFAVLALSYLEDGKSTLLITYLFFFTIFDAAQVRTLHLNGVGASIPPLTSAIVGIKSFFFF